MFSCAILLKCQSQHSKFKSFSHKFPSEVRINGLRLLRQFIKLYLTLVVGEAPTY